MATRQEQHDTHTSDTESDERRTNPRRAHDGRCECSTDNENDEAGCDAGNAVRAVPGDDASFLGEVGET
jgi:hypothetical protein